MAYQPLTFSAGEKLTSTKMNQMAANDAAFHDGSGIDNSAITNSKLADGSVNLDKLDASSLQGSFLPVITSSFTTYGVTVYLFRIANLVIANIGNPVNFIGSTGLPQNTDGGSTEVTVPQGFRPTREVCLPMISTVVISGGASFNISSAGTIRVNSAFSGSGATRLNGSAAWITEDDWPEEA